MESQDNIFHLRYSLGASFYLAWRDLLTTKSQQGLQCENSLSIELLTNFKILRGDFHTFHLIVVFSNVCIHFDQSWVELGNAGMVVSEFFPNDNLSPMNNFLSFFHLFLFHQDFPFMDIIFCSVIVHSIFPYYLRIYLPTMSYLLICLVNILFVPSSWFL